MIGDEITLPGHHRYRIEEVREGGMGRVLFLTRLTEVKFLDRLHRPKLAIKSLKEAASEHSELFLRELNTWISLRVPAIAELLLVTPIRGKLSAVMPWYESSLREHLAKNGPFGSPEALNCVGVVSWCLHRAWREHGVLHLDIKPENILMDLKHKKAGDVVKVTDWGIANVERGAGRLSQRPPAIVPANATLLGFGTLPYMGPERLVGAKPGVPADIFSLAMVFLECVTGRLPYRPDRPLDEQILSGEYLVLAEALLRQVVAPNAALVILKGLDPDPRRRYDDHSRFVSELQRAI
jgi:serine/threonine protein kinase